MKYLLLKSTKSIPEKFCLSLLSIIIFSLVYYLFCRDEEFSGIVELIYKKNKIKYLDSIFNKFSKNKIFITKDEFSKIPLKQYEGDIIYDYNEKPNNKINNEIFDIYDRQNDGKITKSTFKTLPIQYDPEFLDINDMVSGSRKNKFFIEFEKWFYYLYYATVTQAGLGYGDIIPITLKTRFFALSQIIISLIIVFY
jgi:hypothetical protein